MAVREKMIIPQHLKDKYGDNIKIWSFSRCSSVDNCIHEYYLARVLKKPQKENIYTLAGNSAHLVLEDYYNGKIKYEDMLSKFEEEFLGIELGNYKFSNDEDKHKRMRNAYKENVSLFFQNHVPVTSKVVNEKEIWIDVDSEVFVGYVDALHKEDDYYIITDYKTSGLSDYTGSKKPKKAMQLLLYALGLIQLGVPADKIKCRWNFLKYTKVGITYKTKAKKDNIKYKETIAERIKWVDKVKTQLRKDMIAFYTDLEEWQIDVMLYQCIKNNNLDILDKSISENYVLSDAYEYVDVTEESLQGMKDYLKERIRIIESKSTINEDDWNREDIEDKTSFYCSVLCSVKSHCKYWKKYKDSLQEDIYTVKEDSLLAELDSLLNT